MNCLFTTGPEIVLQKQYRPPTDKITVEIPAGLMDAGETAEQCAVRELREETGYVGTAVETSAVMFNGGFSSINTKSRRRAHADHTVWVQIPDSATLTYELCTFTLT